MAPADQLAKILAEAFHKGITDSEASLAKAAAAGATAGADDVANKIITEGSVHTGGVLNFLSGLPIIGGVLNPVEDIFGRMGKLVEGVTLGWALGTALYPTIHAIIEPVEHAVNDALTNEIFDAVTAAQLVAKGLEEHGHGASEAAGSGFDGDHFNHLVGLATTFPALDLLLELQRRGKLPPNYLTTTLKRLGYSDEAIPLLENLLRNLLSPADLALAQLRGVLKPEQVTEYAKQLGVDQADLNVLIGNTGEPPGEMQLLEAYRRHFIDKPTLERGIRQSRIRDEWIGTVERLRYEPMSTADAVRARVEGHIGDAQVRDIADKNGLEPGAIDTLVAAWGRPLSRTEMASLVHRNKATRAQFDQAMRESDIKDKYINFAFESAQRLISERQIVSAIHFGALDTKTGASMLMDLGYDQQSTAILIKLGLAERHVASHELTRAQIVTLYSDGTFQRPQAEKALVTLGYSAQNASYLLTIVDLQQHAKELKAETNAIRDNYLANALTAAEAQAQLTGIGLTVAAASHTITVWNRERARANKLLSEAQIVKAAKTATINVAEAIRLLVAMGYSNGDARVLLLEAGVKIV